jgi:alkylation response protein AidB-like acyl-CoA dehydrogenase
MTMNPIAAAESLRDQVRPRADEIEQGRRFPADLAQAMAASGLLRMLVPAELGGHESEPATVARAIETLAEGDASSGWCLMIAATTAMMSARLSPDHAREVFGDANTLPVCSPPWAGPSTPATTGGSPAAGSGAAARRTPIGWRAARC